MQIGRKNEHLPMASALREECGPLNRRAGNQGMVRQIAFCTPLLFAGRECVETRRYCNT